MRSTLVGLLVTGLLATTPLHAQNAPGGTVDPTFRAPAQTFEHLLPLPDGRFLAAGDFKFLDGAPLNRLARLDADGTVDLSFDSGEAQGAVKIHGLALQADRRILVFGEFEQYQGATRHRIARLLPSGALDPSFTPPTDPSGYLHYPIVSAIPAPNDQGIYIAGTFVGLKYGPVGIARLHNDGSLDDTFKPDRALNTPAYIDAMALDSEGRVLAAGQFPNGFGLRRYLPDGALDATFKQVSVDRPILRLVYQPDGRILAGGYFRQVNGVARGSIVRLHANGAVDSTFTAAPELALANRSAFIRDIELEANGSLIVAGEYQSSGLSEALLIRLRSNGDLDPALVGKFDTRQIAWRRVPAIALTANGSLVASGVFRLTNAPAIENCARFSLGDVPTGLALRASADAAQVSLQVHPGRRITLESAANAAGPWTALASTNPVMSGVWTVRQSTEDHPASFFRVR